MFCLPNDEKYLKHESTIYAMQERKYVNGYLSGLCKAVDLESPNLQFNRTFWRGNLVGELVLLHKCLLRYANAKVISRFY